MTNEFDQDRFFLMEDEEIRQWFDLATGDDLLCLNDEEIDTILGGDFKSEIVSVLCEQDWWCIYDEVAAYEMFKIPLDDSQIERLDRAEQIELPY